MKKEILLIGGCGYIGSSLFDELSKTHNVISVDAEWFGRTVNSNFKCDYEYLEYDYIKKYDTVILTAAHSSVPMCNNDHKGAFNNNVVKFINFIQKLQPNQKFIHASSSCVYIKSDLNGAVETERLKPNDMLSFSKTTIDHYLEAFNPCEWYALRFGSVNGYSRNFRTDLMINAMTKNALIDNKLNISNGDNYRPILGMKDLVRAVKAIVESEEDKRGVYNVASFNVNIREVGNAIAKIIGCEVAEQEGGKSYDFCINTNKFKEAYAFEFKESLETIVQSIAENKQTLKQEIFPQRKV